MALLKKLLGKDVRLEIHSLAESELLKVTIIFLVEIALISEIDFAGRLISVMILDDISFKKLFDELFMVLSDRLRFSKTTSRFFSKDGIK